MKLPNNLEPVFTAQSLDQIRGIENEFRMRVKNRLIFYGDLKKRYDVYFYRNSIVCTKSSVECVKCGEDITNTYKQKYCSDLCARAK